MSAAITFSKIAGHSSVLPSVLGHVGPDAGGDVVVDGADAIDRDAVAPHDLHRDVDQALGVGELRAALQRAVDEECAQIRVVGLALLAEVGLHARSARSHHLLGVWSGRVLPAQCSAALLCLELQDDLVLVDRGALTHAAGRALTRGGHLVQGLIALAIVVLGVEERDRQRLAALGVIEDQQLLCRHIPVGARPAPRLWALISAAALAPSPPSNVATRAYMSISFC